MHPSGADAPAGCAAHRRPLEVFLAVAQAGDLAVLEDAFTEDVVSYSNGGRMPGVWKIPIFGLPHVSGYLAAFAPRFWPRSDVRRAEVNGRPAVLVSAGGNAKVLLWVDVSARGIERITWVMNPAKLIPYVAFAERLRQLLRAADGHGSRSGGCSTRTVTTGVTCRSTSCPQLTRPRDVKAHTI